MLDFGGFLVEYLCGFVCVCVRVFFWGGVNWWLACFCGDLKLTKLFLLMACFCRYLEFEPLAYSGFMCIMA